MRALRPNSRHRPDLQAISSTTRQMLNAPLDAEDKAWAAITKHGTDVAIQASEKARDQAARLPRVHRDKIADAAALTHLVCAVTQRPTWAWLPAPTYRHHLYCALSYQRKSTSHTAGDSIDVLFSLVHHRGLGGVWRNVRRWFGEVPQRDKNIVKSVPLLAAILNEHTSFDPRVGYFAAECGKLKSPEAKAVLIGVLMPAIDAWRARQSRTC